MSNHFEYKPPVNKDGEEDRQFYPNQTVVNYRFVINDAFCRPWEPMPEVGTTLAELVEYLKTCAATRDLLGERWDYRRLIPGGAFDPHIISYGARSQFWLPVIPKKSEFTWTTKDCDKKVVCCGETLEVKEEWDSRANCPDIGYLYQCPKCGRHTMSRSGNLCRTAQDAYDTWIKWFDE